jgi:hypothetical protein
MWLDVTFSPVHIAGASSHLQRFANPAVHACTVHPYVAAWLVFLDLLTLQVKPLRPFRNVWNYLPNDTA